VKQGTTVAFYVRVSTEEQSTDGISLEMQVARLRALCEAHGWTVGRAYQDAGFSAASLNRPAMQRLLTDIAKKRVTAVAIYALDRLTRSVKDLAELLEMFQKRGVAVVSLSERIDTSSAAGRMIVNLLGTVNQWQREAIAERTAAALAHKRDSGKVYGTTPYGFTRVGDHLEPKEEELNVVRRIYRLRHEGHALRTIADMLNADDIPTQTGKRWYPNTVRLVLKTKVYEARGVFTMTA
jgi:site-specific DNA recombinase